MAKVYVSSTIADLEAERQAVIDWLVAAQHQVVHSYRPNSDTVRDSVLEDVDTCATIQNCLDEVLRSRRLADAQNWAIGAGNLAPIRPTARAPSRRSASDTRGL